MNTYDILIIAVCSLVAYVAGLLLFLKNGSDLSREEEQIYRKFLKERNGKRIDKSDPRVQVIA